MSRRPLQCEATYQKWLVIHFVLHYLRQEPCCGATTLAIPHFLWDCCLDVLIDMVLHLTQLHEWVELELEWGLFAQLDLYYLSLEFGLDGPVVGSTVTESDSGVKVSKKTVVLRRWG